MRTVKRDYMINLWLAVDGASNKGAVGDWGEADINRAAKAWRRHTPRGSAFKRMIELGIEKMTLSAMVAHG